MVITELFLSLGMAKVIYGRCGTFRRAVASDRHQKIFSPSPVCSVSFKYASYISKDGNCPFEKSKFCSIAFSILYLSIVCFIANVKQNFKILRLTVVI